MKYMHQLVAEDLKAISWFYSSTAVGTMFQAARSIDPTSMRKDDLIHHLNNTIGLQRIDIVNTLPKYRLAWNRIKTRAGVELATAISSVRQPDEIQQGQSSVFAMPSAASNPSSAAVSGPNVHERAASPSVMATQPSSLAAAIASPSSIPILLNMASYVPAASAASASSIIAASIADGASSNANASSPGLPTSAASASLVVVQATERVIDRIESLFMRLVEPAAFKRRKVGYADSPGMNTDTPTHRSALLSSSTAGVPNTPDAVAQLIQQAQYPYEEEIEDSEDEVVEQQRAKVGNTTTHTNHINRSNNINGPVASITSSFTDLASPFPASLAPIPAGARPDAAQQLSQIIAAVSKSAVKFAKLSDLADALDDWCSLSTDQGMSGIKIQALYKYRNYIVEDLGRRSGVAKAAYYHSLFSKAVIKGHNMFQDGGHFHPLSYHTVFPSHSADAASPSSTTTAPSSDASGSSSKKGAAKRKKVSKKVKPASHPAGSCTHHPSSTSHTTAQCVKKDG